MHFIKIEVQEDFRPQNIRVLKIEVPRILGPKIKVPDICGPSNFRPLNLCARDFKGVTPSCYPPNFSDFSGLNLRQIVVKMTQNDPNMGQNGLKTVIFDHFLGFLALFCLKNT